MKRGKDVRDAKLESLDPNAPREVQVLMFTLVEQAPGAFKLRFVCNEDLIRDLRSQGLLNSFLDDAEELFRDFRDRMSKATPTRPQ